MSTSTLAELAVKTLWGEEGLPNMSRRIEPGASPQSVVPLCKEDTVGLRRIRGDWCKLLADERDRLEGAQRGLHPYDC